MSNRGEKCGNSGNNAFSETTPNCVDCKNRWLSVDINTAVCKIDNSLKNVHKQEDCKFFVKREDLQ